MNFALWVVQGLLALAFTAAGVIKLTQPKDAMREKMPFVDDFGTGAIRLIGRLEVLGATVFPSGRGGGETQKMKGIRRSRAGRALSRIRRRNGAKSGRYFARCRPISEDARGQVVRGGDSIDGPSRGSDGPHNRRGVGVCPLW